MQRRLVTLIKHVAAEQLELLGRVGNELLDVERSRVIARSAEPSVCSACLEQGVAVGYGSITSASDAAVSALEVHQREIERRLCKVERELAQIEPKLERLHTRVRNDILQSILLGVYGVVVVATIVLIVATAVVRAG